MNEEIAQLRDEIDAVDSLIAHLLYERVEISRRIVALRKRDGGEPIDRMRVLQVNSGYIDILRNASSTDDVLDLVGAIMRVCR